MRNELHFFSGHKNDVLTRDLQPRIAKNLGYEDEGDTLGVERFMRDYYLHARRIHRMTPAAHRALPGDAVAPRVGRAARSGSRRWPTGWCSSTAASTWPTAIPMLLRTDPIRLMKVFWHLHRLGCDLSPDLERAIEDSLDVVDDGFRTGRRPSATCSSTSAGRGAGWR